MDTSSAYNPPVEDPADTPPSGPSIVRSPPHGFVDDWDWIRLDSVVATGRLAPWLRAFAAPSFDPLARLRDAALRRLDPTRGSGAMRESNAIADLSVTGREAYSRFNLLRPTDEMVRRAVIAAAPTVDAATVERAVHEVLDRAYSVAWALRGPASVRASMRPGLGWIAVSGEDDAPHAPTNGYCTSDPMGEIAVTVPGFVQRLLLRAAIKLPVDVRPALASLPLREVPEDRLFATLIGTSRPAHYDELAIFVHGLASTLEESEHFKALLIRKALRRGQRLAVLSLDLPGFGYSTRLDVDAVERAAGSFHGFRLPNGEGSNFPLLGLYRDVLVQVSRQLHGGVQHVMGGSLGGNMSLWIAEAPMFSTLPAGAQSVSGLKTVASWSPGSIWESYERARDTPFEGNGTHMDIGKNGAKKRPLERMRKRETPELRRTDFFELMQRGEPLLCFRTGAWGHPPTRMGMELQSELYSEAYRRTFWMAAYEQVVFSHQEPLLRGRWPFLTMRVPLLLAAGARDRGSHDVMNIYDSVVGVTDAHHDMPGRRLLMLETGHSISDERPSHLSGEVAAFFIKPGDRPQWTQVPGQARDIAIGWCGHVWIVGKAQAPGAAPGNGAVARWTGSGWESDPAFGVRIAADAFGRRWVVDSDGRILPPSARSVGEAARARDIAVGGDGSVWVIGTDVPAPGNGGLHRWVGGTRWDQAAGHHGTCIAVDAQGRWLVVNSEMHIYRQFGNASERIGGDRALARDLAVGPDGSIWVIGDDPEDGAPGNYGVHRLNPATGTFVRIEGCGVAIAVDVAGRPWVMRVNGDIYRVVNALGPA